MRVLINALSVNNLSGRHVLLGHLENLAKWTIEKHEYVVLFHHDNRDICSDLGSNVEWVEVSKYTSHWIGRSIWERVVLPGLSNKFDVDFLFNPAGIVIPSLRIPQVAFAQNPWALVPKVKKTFAEKIKASIQRRNYAYAMKASAMMIFNSEYMRQAYRHNANTREENSQIVYQGISDDAYAYADKLKTAVVKKPLQILCVSVMGPHKGVETVIDALGVLHNRYQIKANLVIAGTWPDSAYKNRIMKLIKMNKLEHAVHIKGYVEEDALFNLYAESKIFCLMSYCESFGIPAVEAQAFGTPVVSSDCCAIPEIVGKGGLFSKPGDAEAVAESLARLLSDVGLWAKLSHEAIENAQKYKWEMCSRPLLRMFDVMECK